MNWSGLRSPTGKRPCGVRMRNPLSARSSERLRAEKDGFMQCLPLYYLYATKSLSFFHLFVCVCDPQNNRNRVIGCGTMARGWTKGKWMLAAGSGVQASLSVHNAMRGHRHRRRRRRDDHVMILGYLSGGRMIQDTRRVREGYLPIKEYYMT